MEKKVETNYNLIGKRADYTPWGCMKVINATVPGKDEFHGCPFKTFSEDNLYNLLASYKGLKGADIKKIIDKRNEGQSQVRV
jgi:DNA primase large subunit